MKAEVHFIIDCQRDKMITAVMSQPVVKTRQLKDLGITYKKDTGN